MRLFAKEAWGYAVLLLILFAIATLAVWQTILHIEDIVGPREFPTVAGLIWALCLGFMFIAGAFGLWSIQFSAIAESRRRISELVTAMDTMRDGLLAIDRRGRVRGSNPAAHELCGRAPGDGDGLQAMYPCLDDEDLAALVDRKEPWEMERHFVQAGSPRTLRFRSQPAAGLTLILVSDVTAMQARRQHRQQAATLQLIGQLARGVANDFNNLLCGIAGHASLLPRLRDGSPERSESIRAIAGNAARGIALAGHLLELSRPAGKAGPTGMTAQHVRNAVSVLHDALPLGWQIDTALDDVPATAMTGMQIEQIVANLAQLLVDRQAVPGRLHIVCGRPGTHPLLKTDPGYAGAVAVTQALADDPSPAPPGPPPAGEGVILSVLRSIIEGAGGRLHQLTGPRGYPVYRVDLPMATVAAAADTVDDMPFELGAYLANWRVVFAGDRARNAALLEELSGLGVHLAAVDTIPSMLARIEEAETLDAIVIDWSLLGTEEESLLKAIERLAPGTGLVVLRDETRTVPAPPDVHAVDVPVGAAVKDVLMTMIEARSLAVGRRHHA